MKVKYAEMFVSGEEVDNWYNSESCKMSILTELESELCQREDDSEECIENYTGYSELILNLLRSLQIENVENMLLLPSNFKYASEAISNKIEQKILECIHDEISYQHLIAIIDYVSMELSKVSLMILENNYKDINNNVLYKTLLTDLKSCPEIAFSYKIKTPINKKFIEDNTSLLPNVLKTSMCLEYTFFAVYSKRSENYHTFKLEIGLNELNDYELNKLLSTFLKDSTCIKQ